MKHMRRAALLVFCGSSMLAGCACGPEQVAHPAVQIALRDDQSGAAIEGATIMLTQMGANSLYFMPEDQRNGFYIVWEIPRQQPVGVSITHPQYVDMRQTVTVPVESGGCSIAFQLTFALRRAPQS